MEKKKILSICTLLILVIGIIFITFPNHNNKRVNKSNSDNLIRLDDSAISLMIETEMGSGEYELSNLNTWPTTGYVYNGDLSYCENGSELIYDETNGLQLKTTLSDKCYIYYDKETDIAITTTYNGYAGVPIAVGLDTALSCTGATAIYNNQYNRVEISGMSTRKANCNLEYTDRTSKTYLNNKIIGLSGTTQGTGQVVHEIFNQGDFSNVTELTQSEYISTSQYYSSYDTSTSGTTVTNAFSFSNNEWSSNPSNLTSNRYYHFNFTVPSAGAYRLCYEISNGSMENRLYVYQGSTNIKIKGSSYVSASSSSKGCVDLGYAKANTKYRVVQRTYTTIATLKFSVQKSNSITTVDTGYRYEGKKPNNYIWFNNELWRIIGVFDSTSHGQTDNASTTVKENQLVKIIREEPIGSLSWDNNQSNNWSMSSVYKLLNPIEGDNNSGAYYKKNNGTNSGYCYGYSASNAIESNCDYSQNGISATYRPMIKKITWYLGGMSSSSSAENYYLTTVDKYYKYERDTTSKFADNPGSATGYIGLMYASDYGYSVIESASCPRITNVNAYHSNNCAGQSWLYGQGDEWTITNISSGSNYASFINYSGSASSHGVVYGYKIRPVLYLDSNVYFISGTGAIDDPYIIGM